MKKVKIKLSKQEVMALRDLFVMVVPDFDPVGYSHMMVKEIMEEVLQQLDKMANNYEQRRFTLRMTKVQAMGFVIFTSRLDLDKIPYEAQIIRRSVQEIEHCFSRPVHANI